MRDFAQKTTTCYKKCKRKIWSK